jgi:hypothetical protein
MKTSIFLLILALLTCKIYAGVALGLTVIAYFKLLTIKK